MLFDAQVQVAQLEIGQVEDHIQLAMVLALQFPVAQDSVMPIPAAVLRFGMGKEAAIKYGQELIEKASELDDPEPQPQSDLVVAQSLAGIDEAVKLDSQLKGSQ